MPAKAKRDTIPESLQHFDRLPDSAGVRQPTVERLYGISASTVWRRVRDGKLPRPIKHSDRVSLWNVGQLRAALARAKEAK